MDLATAAVAVLPLLFVKIPQPDKPDAVARPRQSVWRESIESLRLLANWKGLFILTLATAIVPFFGSPAHAMAPLLIAERFDGGAMHFGLFMVADNVGAIVGGILFSMWAEKTRKYNIMLGVGVVFGLFSILQGVTPAGAYWLFLGASFMPALAASAYFASVRVLIQQSVAPEAQGRMFALQNGFLWSAAPLGLATIGPASGIIGLHVPFILRGIAMLSATLIFFLSRSVREIEGTKYKA